MFEIIEEMGLTLGEIIGAALVFAGFTGGMLLLREYGAEFMQILVG